MKQAKSSDSTGKRVVFREQGMVIIEDFPLEETKPGQVLIRTVSSLISPGTETAFLMALPNTPKKFPMHPGYSNAGVVAASGSETSKFKLGDRVVSRTNHATHAAVLEENVMKIPEDLSFDEASFFALGSIALQGVRKAHIELGESVVVLGQGLVGNLALQLAKLSGGMPVIGVDMYDYRLQMSRKCGADHTFNPLLAELVEAVKNVTDGEGANVVIESTGNPGAVATALEVVAKFGRVIILGSTRGTSEINFYSLVHKKGVSITGAHESARPLSESSHGWWTQRDDSALILKLINNSSLKVRDLVTERLSFQKADEAYRKLMESKDRVLGIILNWEEG